MVDSPGTMEADWAVIRIKSRMEEVPDAREGIHRALRAAGWNRESCLPVLLALDESLVNAVEHGNGGDARKSVTVRYRIESDRVTIEVADEGPGFPPGDIKPIDSLPPYADSGRGIFLIRSLMDEVSFNAEGNGILFAKSR